MPAKKIMTAEEQVDAIVKKHLAAAGGEESTYAYTDEDVDARLHPGAIHFLSDDPNPSFTGFAKKPLFETHVMLGECEDDHVFRIDRKGDVLLFTRFETSNTQGVLNASGQALVCKKGSAGEHQFMRAAMLEVLETASEPLCTVLRDIKKAGIRMGGAAAAQLKGTVFGPAEAL